MKWLAKLFVLFVVGVILCPFSAGCGSSYMSEEAARKQQANEPEQEETADQPGATLNEPDAD